MRARGPYPAATTPTSDLYPQLFPPVYDDRRKPLTGLDNEPRISHRKGQHLHPTESFSSSAALPGRVPVDKFEDDLTETGLHPRDDFINVPTGMMLVSRISRIGRIRKRSSLALR